MQAKIFLDSGNPLETKQALKLIGGLLVGQTTNPSLVAKNPQLKGKTYTSDGLMDFYKEVIQEISNLIPKGSVSIEVYADEQTSTKNLLDQAEKMYTWIPNAHIKFPTTRSGLQACQSFVKNGGRVNMTLVFTQLQAAAVHLASSGLAQNDQVFLSPFVGRLDDRGNNGIDLIKNIKKMYLKNNSKIQILAASIRSLDHLMGSLVSGADILTLPLKIVQDWSNGGQKLPDSNYEYRSDLKPIAYEELPKLETFGDWTKLDIYHQQTEEGLDKFAKDWNSLIK